MHSATLHGDADWPFLGSAALSPIPVTGNVQSAKTLSTTNCSTCLHGNVLFYSVCSFSVMAFFSKLANLLPLVNVLVDNIVAVIQERILEVGMVKSHNSLVHGLLSLKSSTTCTQGCAL